MWSGDRLSPWEIVKVVIVKMIRELGRRQIIQSKKLDVFNKGSENL